MDSERRSVTIVYADISGFTAISEKLDPEEVTDVMNRCFEMLEGVVLAHGGAVNKYLGDCVMALFGLTEIPEVAARQAVQAALEIRSSLYRFNQENTLPSPLDVHVGVNGGPVLAGMIGGEVRREFTVTGDAVLIAARLEDASERGQIFVGPQTHTATADLFEYRTVEAIQLRESEAPIPVFELLGPRETRKRIKRQSERRRATVLFADVHGFKALAERLSPEDITALLNRCLTALATIVDGFGGVVDKYIGECVMALFGVPNAIENAPQQAVNAAIEMRNRLARFNRDEQLPVPLQIHIGVNTGLVIAGEIGGKVRRDFTVMGDTVNLASRLKDASVLGAIYVGPETHRSTQDAFQFKVLQPLSLKGKAEPVPTYEVLSEQGEVHRTNTSTSARMIASTLVGREKELKELQSAMLRTIGGVGGIVNVIGEAGLGKSRLMAEALTLHGLERATVLQGRCTSIGQNLSFHPFVDLLRQWAGIGDEDVEPRAEEKLEAAIRHLLPEQTSEVFPFVATLMGLRLSGEHAERVRGIDPDSLERLMVKGTRDLFQSLASSKPLILIFEDLHWADQSSVKLLESILRLVQDRPVLFLHLFRPDYEATAERILRSAVEGFAGRSMEIRIEPLDAREASLLVNNLLQIEDLPAETRKLITERAEGNPFFIEEVVRSFIDAGAVEFVDGRYRVTDKIESVVIPGTVQEVVMARVDRLDESTRHLLQVASVIGRNFYHRIIAEILRRQGQFDDELDGELSTLKEKQLLLERKTHWSVAIGELSVVEELEYIFKHALAQQTVYESLLHKTRKEFHASVGETIELLFGDRITDFYGMLAYHYDRAERLEKAEDYMFRAGEESARSAASTEALNYFQGSARLYRRLHGDGGDPRHWFLLEKNIGTALLNTGKLTECIEHFDRALATMGERQPQSPIALQTKFGLDLAAVFCDLYLLHGRRRLHPGSDRDRELYQIMNTRIRAFATSDPKRIFIDNIGGVRRMNRIDPTTMEEACSVYAVAGGMFSFAGVSFDVSRRFHRIATACQRPGKVNHDFDCRHLLFTINYLEGRWQTDDLIDDETIENCIRFGLFWDVQTYLGLACDRLFRQGRFERARRCLDRLADLRDNYSYEFAGSNHDGESAMYCLERRELAKARETADRYFANRQENTLRVLALGIRAKAQVLSGDLPGAEDSLRTGESLVNETGIVPPWHLSTLAVARLLFDTLAVEAASTGERRVLARQAQRSRRKALRVVAKSATQRTEVLRLSGTLAWLMGRQDDARSWWRKSLEQGLALDAQPEFLRTCAEAGRRIDGARLESFGLPGDGETDLLTRARLGFSSLGLDHDQPTPS